MKKIFFVFILTLVVSFMLPYASFSAIRSGGDINSKWLAGQSTTVDLTGVEYNRVNVYLWVSYSSEYIKVLSNVNPNDDNLLFIPEDLKSGNYYKLKVTDAENESNCIISNNFFNIYKSEEVTSVNTDDNSSVVCYPIPAKDYITITGVSPIQTELYNVLGNMVAEYNGTTVLNVGNIPSGVYYVIITTNDNKFVKKVEITK